MILLAGPQSGRPGGYAPVRRTNPKCYVGSTGRACNGPLIPDTLCLTIRRIGVDGSCWRLCVRRIALPERLLQPLELGGKRAFKDEMLLRPGMLEAQQPRMEGLPIEPL